MQARALGRWFAHGGIGQLLENLLEHQLLAFHAADVAEFVVAESQEALQGLTLEQLLAGIEIDVQPLAVVHVVHPLGHIHLHPADGIRQPLHGIEVEHQVAIHPG